MPPSWRPPHPTNGGSAEFEAFKEVGILGLGILGEIDGKCACSLEAGKVKEEKDFEEPISTSKRRLAATHPIA